MCTHGCCLQIYVKKDEDECQLTVIYLVIVRRSYSTIFVGTNKSIHFKMSGRFSNKIFSSMCSILYQPQIISHAAFVGYLYPSLLSYYMYVLGRHCSIESRERESFAASRHASRILRYFFLSRDQFFLPSVQHPFNSPFLQF